VIKKSIKVILDQVFFLNVQITKSQHQLNLLIYFDHQKTIYSLQTISFKTRQFDKRISYFIILFLKLKSILG